MEHVKHYFNGEYEKLPGCEVVRTYYDDDNYYERGVVLAFRTSLGIRIECISHELGGQHSELLLPIKDIDSLINSLNKLKNGNF